MIDFSTLQALSIPEGVVTEIADASGRVLWAANMDSEKPAIFEVTKQTASTYSGETQYVDEQFILLDIYPKKGGTVKVTYGGLTKTVVDTSGAEEPNAQQVFFGTFNGVSDEVETPASGRLTIEGAYRGYGSGSYGAYANKTSGSYAPCITNVIDVGNPVYIGNYTFDGCTNLALTELPSGLTYIGIYAFRNCSNLALTELPSGLTYIGANAFYQCEKLAITSIPSGITTIEQYAFYDCSNLAITELPNGVTAIGMYAFYQHKLASITIPSTVTSIGARAFGFHFGTRENPFRVTMLGATPPTLGTTTVGSDTVYQQFYSQAEIAESTGTEITVPNGCGDTYKAATGWAKYASVITEAS